MFDQIESVSSGIDMPSRSLVQCIGTLVTIDSAGTLWVDLLPGKRVACDMLQTGIAPQLGEGDPVLIAVPEGSGRGVVLGRVGRYVPPGPPKELELAATESLSLRCGEASLTLRADGKVMVKGEDVLIRAKGTQRIRAGNVAIN